MRRKNRTMTQNSSVFHERKTQNSGYYFKRLAMHLTDMNLTDLAALFQRAFTLTLNKKKLLFTSAAIAACGLFAIFFMSLAFTANAWMALSLQFSSIFIAGMVLTGFGVVLIRNY